MPHLVVIYLSPPYLSSYVAYLPADTLNHEFLGISMNRTIYTPKKLTQTGEITLKKKWDRKNASHVKGPTNRS